MIAGNHDHAYAGLMAFFHCSRHRATNRVGQACQTKPDKIKSGGIGRPVIACMTRLRHRQHTHALCGKLFNLLLHFRSLPRIESAQARHG